jgi:hypothetical protein
MGLNTTPKPSSKYGPGVFITEATIIDAQDHSGTKPSFLSNTPDVYVVITLDVGREFTPEMSFFGDFKRDDKNPKVIVDWGSAFKIRNLFSACGVHREINDDGTIPPEMIQELIGKKILRLQYISGTKDNGKLKYSDWSEQVFEATGDPKKLAELFFKSVDRGYPKNYSPEVLTEDDSFDTTDTSDMAIPAAAEVADKDF